MGVTSERSERARRAFLEFRRSKSPQALTEVFDLCAQELLLLAHHIAARGVAPEDLLQATFLQAIRVADAYNPSRALMPWLCGILINVARSQNREQRREFEAWRLDESTVDDPADIAHALEFAEALSAAISEFPAPQREVLTLRMIHGLTPTEIAHALGHPVGSVKSWIHRGLERLERILPAAFAAALASIAHSEPNLSVLRAELIQTACGPHPVAPIAPVGNATIPRAGWWGGGGLLASVLLAVIVGAIWVASEGEPGSIQETIVATHAIEAGGRAEASDRRIADAAPIQSRSTDDHVALVIRIRFAGDGAPASVGLRLEPRFGADTSLRTLFVHTDESGEARVPQLAPGPYTLLPDRGPPHTVIVGEHGGSAEIALASGIAVSGRVVDANGRALANARIWLSRQDVLDEGEFVAATDTDGRFSLRDIPAGRAIAVLADGFAPSPLRAISATREQRTDFQLTAAGDFVRGVIHDESGAPIAGATVMFGEALDPRWSGEFLLAHDVFAPLSVETDATGRFVCANVPRGSATTVWARAAGRRLHVARIEHPDQLDLSLDRGASWRGRTQAGPDEIVELAVEHVDASTSAVRPRWADPSAVCRAGADFQLSGLPLGNVVLRIGAALDRSRTHETSTVLGSTVDWSPRENEVARIFGVAQSESGVALAGYRVEASTSRGAIEAVVTDSTGGFEFGDIGDEPRTLRLLAPQREHDSVLFHRARVRPTLAVVDLTIPDERVPSAHVVARIVDLSADRVGQLELVDALDQSGTPALLEADGRVRFGPLSPGVFFVMIHGEMGPTMTHGPISVRAGETVECGDLFERPTGRVAFEVANLPPTGPDLINAALTTLDGGIGVTFLKLQDGRGTCLPVPPGKYRLSVNSPQLGNFQHIVEVLEGVTSEVRLDAPTGIPATVFVRGPQVCEQLRVLVGVSRSDGDEVIRIARFVRNVEPEGTELFTGNLAPGLHRIDAIAGSGLRGQVEFEVPSGVENASCIIELH